MQTFFQIVIILAVLYGLIKLFSWYEEYKYVIMEEKRRKEKFKLLQQFKEQVKNKEIDNGYFNRLSSYITVIEPKDFIFSYYNHEDKLVAKREKKDSWFLFYENVLIALGGYWYDYGRPFDDTGLVLDAVDFGYHIFVEDIKEVRQIIKPTEIKFEVDSITADKELLTVSFIESDLKVIDTIRKAFNDIGLNIIEQQLKGVIKINYTEDFMKYLDYLKNIKVETVIDIQRKVLLDVSEKIVSVERDKQLDDRNKYKYIDLLKGLNFFLMNGRKPDSVPFTSFQLYKPLVQQYVEKGFFKDTILKAFEKEIE